MRNDLQRVLKGQNPVANGQLMPSPSLNIEQSGSVGIVVGLAGALALTQVLSSLFYRVKPSDPINF